MREEGKRIRVNLVRKLKRELNPPKKWRTIARECYVHPGTLKRWLAYEPARIDNIALLAKSLGTTVDEIILPDGEDDLTDYVEAKLTVEGNLAELEQPKDITAIIEAVQRLIGPKYKIMLMYVGAGSIEIGIRLHARDAVRLTKSFIRGQLTKINIKAIAFTSWLPEYLTDKNALKKPKKPAFSSIQSEIYAKQKTLLRSLMETAHKVNGHLNILKEHALPGIHKIGEVIETLLSPITRDASRMIPTEVAETDKLVASLLTSIYALNEELNELQKATELAPNQD